MKNLAIGATLAAAAMSMSACSTLKGAAIGGAGGAGVAAATGGRVGGDEVLVHPDVFPVVQRLT